MLSLIFALLFLSLYIHRRHFANAAKKKSEMFEANLALIVARDISKAISLKI